MYCARCKGKLNRVVDAVVHVMTCYDPRWKDVYEARQAGDHGRATRIVRNILGVKGPEMSTETKEKLRAYAKEHAEEIKAKRKAQAVLRRRVKELLKVRRKR